MERFHLGLPELAGSALGQHYKLRRKPNLANPAGRFAGRTNGVHYAAVGAQPVPGLLELGLLSFSDKQYLVESHGFLSSAHQASTILASVWRIN